MKHPTRIGILGAGICGLSLAHFLQKRFGDSIDITILEAKNRVGGWLQTEVHNNAVFECGPRSLRETSSELGRLIKDVGLDKELIVAQSLSQTRYILSGGKLEPLPNSLSALFFTKLGRKVLFAILKEPFGKKADSDDESVASFFKRRIGKEATDTFISALCAGIYASCPEDLSMRSCFKSLWEQEEKHGSLVKAKVFSKSKFRAKSFTFRGGIEELPKKIAANLKASIVLNEQITSIVPEEPKQNSKIVVTGNSTYEFDHLFSTISPSVLEHMLPDNDTYKPVLAIPATSLVTVSVAFNDALVIPDGFGFLCPRNEDVSLLGIVFDSKIFPEQNGNYKTRLSIMMGGTRCPDMVGFSDEVLLAYVREFLQKYLAISALPDYSRIVRAQNAISRYPIGHYRTLQAIGQEVRNLTLVGSGLYGVSVGDSVTSAYNAAQSFRI